MNIKIKFGGEATVLNLKFVSLKVHKTKLEQKILNTKIKIGEATVFKLKVCELAAPRPKVQKTKLELKILNTKIKIGEATVLNSKFMRLKKDKKGYCPDTLLI